jgi:uncharacterized protein YecT (DUF1311 family)
MPQVDLSTLSALELRGLLESARRQGHAAQSYAILQEMAQRRERANRRGPFRKPTPRTPALMEVGGGGPPPEFDDVPPMEDLPLHLTEPPAEAPLRLHAAPVETPAWNLDPAPEPEPAATPEPEPALRLAPEPLPEPELQLAREPRRKARKPRKREVVVEEEAPLPPPLLREPKPRRIGWITAGVALGVVMGVGIGWGIAQQGSGPGPTVAQFPEAPMLPPAKPAPPPVLASKMSVEVASQTVAPPPAVAQAAPAPVEAAPAPTPELPDSAAPAPPPPVAETPVSARDEDVEQATGCKAQTTAADRTICGAPRLQKLQKELRQAYAEALKAHEDKATLRARELAWRDARNDVSDEAKLTALYEARIKKLRAATADAERQSR